MWAVDRIAIFSTDSGSPLPAVRDGHPVYLQFYPNGHWGFADSVEKIAILSKKGRRWGTTVKKVLVLSTDEKPIPMERD